MRREASWEKKVEVPERSVAREVCFTWCRRLGFNRGFAWSIFLALMVGAMLHAFPAQAMTCPTSAVQTKARR